MKKLKRPEIMAPAGDFICLDAALNAGADAVYFGLRGSNMRVGARNFELKDLKKISAECKRHGAKSYLTLNTIYFDSELKQLEKILKSAKSAGIDAVIAWDFSVFELARKAGMEVFLSTQASVANAVGIASYFKKFGIKRFVLARECTLENLFSIRANLKKILGARDSAKIRIEVFAHGAMCVSMSGRCFMSEFQCGKSANRGECMQPCRREYSVTPVGNNSAAVAKIAADGGALTIGEDYVLSPKDLCVIGFIEKLFEAGVDSLKIEGRNRNAQYVDTTTRAYVRARDFYFDNIGKPNFEEDFGALKKELQQSLSTVFTRGFSEGFYMGRPISGWTSGGNVASKSKKIVGHVTNYFSKLCVAEISVDDNSLSVGEVLEVEGETTGYFNFKVESIHLEGTSVEQAKKGDLVGVKVPRKVRKSDRIFKLA